LFSLLLGQKQHNKNTHVAAVKGRNRILDIISLEPT